MEINVANLRYDILQYYNSKGADQTADEQAGLHLDVHKPPGFLEPRPNLQFPTLRLSLATCRTIMHV